MKSSASVSITRRLVVTVLILELLSAAALITAITVHEWSVQLEIFDTSLVATAESLMGAVQDTEDEGDNVMLDMRGVRLAKDAVFRVEDEGGKVLGSAGEPPHLEATASGAPLFRNIRVSGRDYRFIVLNGTRIVDPGKATAEFATASPSFMEPPYAMSGMRSGRRFASLPLLPLSFWALPQPLWRGWYGRDCHRFMNSLMKRSASGRATGNSTRLRARKRLQSCGLWPQLSKLRSRVCSVRSSSRSDSPAMPRTNSRPMWPS